MGYIQLKTEIPGPKSRALQKRRDHSVAQGIATNLPIEVAHADGAIITDRDGNRLIDLAAGIGSLNVGHAPEQVTEALKKQLEHYINPAFPVTMHEPYISLAEKLNELVPGNFNKKSILFNSGAEAVENAVKIARRYTKRTGIISFERGFHGRTFMAMSLTSKVQAFKKGFGPMVPDVYKLPYPYSYRDNRTDKEVLVAFNNLFQTTIDPTDIAAVILEPVQGDGGLVVPSIEFMEGVRELCSYYGILMIADEVQTGFARTGTFFAMEQFGIAADMTVVGKSLGAGIPLSGVVGKAEVMDAPAVKELGTTLGGNPLGCIAGIEVIKMIEENKLTERANKIGKQIHQALDFPSKSIGEVRGLGAMIGIEFVKDKNTKASHPALAKQIVRYCHQHGVIVLTAGAHGHVIRLLPPLTITDKQLEEALAVLINGIKEFEEEEFK